MFKLLASLLMQLFFSKPPGISAGTPPPDSSTFLPALDIAFMALFVILVDVNYPDRSATTILAGGSGE